MIIFVHNDELLCIYDTMNVKIKHYLEKKRFCTNSVFIVYSWRPCRCLPALFSQKMHKSKSNILPILIWYTGLCRQLVFSYLIIFSWKLVDFYSLTREAGTCFDKPVCDEDPVYAVMVHIKIHHWTLRLDGAQITSL